MLIFSRTRISTSLEQIRQRKIFNLILGETYFLNITAFTCGNIFCNVVLGILKTVLDDNIQGFYVLQDNKIFWLFITTTCAFNMSCSMLNNNLLIVFSFCKSSCFLFNFILRKTLDWMCKKFYPSAKDLLISKRL